MTKYLAKFSTVGKTSKSTSISNQFSKNIKIKVKKNEEDEYQLLIEHDLTFIFTSPESLKLKVFLFRLL